MTEDVGHRAFNCCSSAQGFGGVMLKKGQRSFDLKVVCIIRLYSLSPTSSS
jgi:hypothetical protein